jgi:hypothetical protein
MIVVTPEGFSADVIEQGDFSLQVICDRLNQTHFSGTLPLISVHAVSSFKHSTQEVLHAITFKVEELPDFRPLGRPWVILIHKEHTAFPEVAQLLLHEMTHVLLPDENPYHSQTFWATLREKWMLDLDLLLGVGLNGDERPSGLTKELLDATSIYRDFGF